MVGIRYAPNLGPSPSQTTCSETNAQDATSQPSLPTIQSGLPINNNLRSQLESR